MRSALHTLDSSETAARFYECYNDSDSLMVSDGELLGTVEPYWDGCRWLKVKDSRGRLVAHVSRFAQQIPRALIASILTDAKADA